MTLTSVVPFGDPGDANGPHFTTHGTATATLPNQDGGSDSVTLTMGF